MVTAQPTPTALLDVNVILDVLLERHPFYDESEAIWKECDEGRLDGHVAAVTIPTIFYIGRKLLGVDKAREAVAPACRHFELCPCFGKRLMTLS